MDETVDREISDFVSSDFAENRQGMKDFNPLNSLVKRPEEAPREDIGRLVKPSRLVVTGLELHPFNPWAISKFLTPTGKILSRKETGLSAKKQRKLAKAIKAARSVGLLGYTTSYSPSIEDNRRANYSPYVVEDKEHPLNFDQHDGQEHNKGDQQTVLGQGGVGVGAKPDSATKL